MAELTGAPAAASPSEGEPEAPRSAVPTGGSRSTAWTLVHTAALSAAAVGLLLLGVLTGRYVLAVLVIPLQVLLMLAWLAALNASGLLWSAVVVSGSAVAADLVTASGPLGVRRLAGVIAVSLLIAMLAQLLRRDGRVNLTTSLAAALGAVVLVAGLAVLVALRRTTAGHDAAMTALIGTGGALVVARGFDAVRLHHSRKATRRRSVTGLVLAGAVAIAIGWLVGAVRSSLGVGDGIALATASAVVALAADIGLDIARAGQPPDASADRARAALLPLSVLLPVCLAAPSAYVAGRVLLG